MNYTSLSEITQYFTDLCYGKQKYLFRNDLDAVKSFVKIIESFENVREQAFNMLLQISPLMSNKVWEHLTNEIIILVENRKIPVRFLHKLVLEEKFPITSFLYQEAKRLQRELIDLGQSLSDEQLLKFISDNIQQPQKTLFSQKNVIPEEYYTLEVTADVLDLTVSELLSVIEQIPGHRDGNTWKFKKHDVDKYQQYIHLEEGYYSLRKTCEILNITEELLHEWISEGKIRAFRRSTQLIKFRKEDVEALRYKTEVLEAIVAQEEPIEAEEVLVEEIEVLEETSLQIISLETEEEVFTAEKFEEEEVSTAEEFEKAKVSTAEGFEEDEVSTAEGFDSSEAEEFLLDSEEEKKEVFDFREEQTRGLYDDTSQDEILDDYAKTIQMGSSPLRKSSKEDFSGFLDTSEEEFGEAGLDDESESIDLDSLLGPEDKDLFDDGDAIAEESEEISADLEFGTDSGSYVLESADDVLIDSAGELTQLGTREDFDIPSLPPLEDSPEPVDDEWLDAKKMTEEIESSEDLLRQEEDLLSEVEASTSSKTEPLDLGLIAGKDLEGTLETTPTDYDTEEFKSIFKEKEKEEKKRDSQIAPKQDLQKESKLMRRKEVKKKADKKEVKPGAISKLKKRLQQSLIAPAKKEQDIPAFEKALGDNAGRPGFFERLVAQSTLAMKAMQATFELRFIIVANAIDTTLGIVSNYIQGIFQAWKMTKSIQRRMQRRDPKKQLIGLMDDLVVARYQMSRLFSLPGFCWQDYQEIFQNHKIEGSNICQNGTFSLKVALELRNHLDEMKRDLSLVTVKEAKAAVQKSLWDFIMSFIPNPMDLFSPWKDFFILAFVMRYNRKQVYTIYIDIVMSYQDLMESLEQFHVKTLAKDYKNDIPKYQKQVVHYEENLRKYSSAKKKQTIEQAIAECRRCLQRAIQALCNCQKICDVRHWNNNDILKELHHAHSLSTLHCSATLELEKRLVTQVEKVLKQKKLKLPKSERTLRIGETKSLQRRYQLQQKIRKMCL